VNKEAASANYRPDKLDVRRFARDQARLEGVLTLSQLERLREDAFGVDADALDAIQVRWAARGIWRELQGGAAQTRLQLSVSTSIPLQCQRCLEAATETLEVDREFLFVSNEATAERLDEESEEDVLVASKTFDLLELIEDELLMALPIVPRHEQCASGLEATQMSEFDDFPDEEGDGATGDSTPSPSPFAALKNLKRH
jgi:uncharacterized protein